MQYDLLIKGGRIIDPAQDMDQVADVALANGKVARMAPEIPASRATRSFDAKGRLVMPGLVDMHTHVYWGATRLGIDADRYAGAAGTTTWVDAGTSGAATFVGFRRFIIENAKARIVPFLNISTDGLIANDGAYENVRRLDVDLAVDVIEQNRDLIKGVKVLSCRLFVGHNDLTPLRLALEVGEATDLPVMCHIGTPPPGLRAILPIMRPGDIITHCYKGDKGCLVIARNKVRPEAWEARQRGVLFDVGHGAGSFSWEVARAALDQDFLPDTISTDLWTDSVNGPAFSMPSVMSKFHHLGMGLREIVRLCTTRPAEILGMADEIGSLKKGACGDVAVLRVEEGEFPLKDCEGVEEVLRKRFSSLLTVRAGEILEAR